MKNVSLSIFVVLASCVPSFAVEVRLSGSPTDPLASPDLNLDSGTTGHSLWVWVDPDPDQIINGLSLDLTSSNPGLLSATAFTIDNPSITEPFPVSRWQGMNSGNLNTNEGRQLVDDSNAIFVVGGFGINDFAEEDDPLFANDYYRHAELVFNTSSETGVTLVTPAIGGLIIVDTFGNALTPSFVGASISVGGLLGDFDADGILGMSDLNELTRQTASGMNENQFDLNNDQLVDVLDISVWVKDFQNTWIGDSNLDGEFNSTDLVEVFRVGKFERDIDSVWNEGDWDGDGRFGTSDFITAFQDGGYELGPRTDQLKAVPEPCASFLTRLLLVGTVLRYRRPLVQRGIRFVGR